MALVDFNAAEVEPLNMNDPIPAGTYLCIAQSSEMKANNAGTGEYLQFEFRVVEGPHKNRRVWDRLNLRHPNPTAVEIARRTLSSICRAAGKTQISDSAELHDIPINVRVIVKDDQKNGPKNEVRGYSKPGTQPQAAQTATAPAAEAPAAAAPASDAPPWRK